MFFGIINIWYNFGMTYLITHFKMYIKIFDGLSKKSRTLLIFNAISLILIIVSQFYLVMFYNTSLPIYITSISIIGLLAYFYLVYIAY